MSQKVKLTEIFAYIKNQFAEQKSHLRDFFLKPERFQNGRSVPIQPAIERRREQLGLGKVPDLDYGELNDIMKMVGLDKLVEDKKTTDKKEGS